MKILPSETKPKLLFCSSRVPFPIIAGYSIRVINLLRILATHFDVTLVALGAGSENDACEIKRQTGVKEIVFLMHSAGLGVFGALRAFFAGDPLQIGYYKSPKMRNYLIREGNKFNVLIFHLVRTAWACPPNLLGRSIIEMCDLLSENYAQTYRKSSWLSPWKVVSWIEKKRLRRFEIFCADNFAGTTLHTMRDMGDIGPRLGSRALISTQGVDIEKYRFTPPSARHGFDIIFVGKIDFFPNRDGVEWFACEVLPLLPKAYSLKVIGDCSKKLKAKLMKIERVQVTGRVESIEAEVINGIVAIAPMRVATGVQNKVLEYFALGLPVISSEDVSAGLLNWPTPTHIIAKSATEWANEILKLASDEIKMNNLALNARNYVEKMHNWVEIGDQYLKFVSLISPLSVPIDNS